MKLTSKEEILHQSAVETVRAYTDAEVRLIPILQQVEKTKLYKKFEVSSLFMYATAVLGLSESVAYAFIAVARKARGVPALQAAIQTKKLSVSKASRLTPALNPDNADQLIEFASCHTSRQIDFEIAKHNPKLRKERVKPISSDLVEVTMLLPKQAFEDLERIGALEAQCSRNPSYGERVGLAAADHLNRRDPVRRAERAQNKVKKAKNIEKSARVQEAPQLRPVGVANSQPRQPPTAAQKNAVFARYQGKCTHVDGQGKRCNQDRWIHIHHIIPVSQGGSNDPDNLTTLCSFHHDLVHQLSLPIEGQVTWLREPTVAYG